jgi:alpha-ketoglutarate-dependent taurine dioxygenase
MSGTGLSPEQRRALAVLEDAIRAPGVVLELTLERGQVLMFDNRRVLHGRTRYADHPDEAARRHLVRLWLSAADTSILTD